MSKNLKNEDELVDYEDDEVETTFEGKENGITDKKKGSYVGIHTSAFRDLLLKPEILRAVQESGFEHPSEVQQECIPQAILGMDLICQAKSGMGKTAVFVLSVLQQIEPLDGVVDTLVLCHTRELAHQISEDFRRFKKHFPTPIRVMELYGGVPEKENKRILKEEPPHIVVGTPGRTLSLCDDGSLKLDKLQRFILDECDSLLESLDMRRAVQKIFKFTPREKQVMLFSATISKEIRAVARRFSRDPIEVFIDDESKLTLHGLIQHFVKLSESEKNRNLRDLLDNLEFNQIIIFVNTVRRASELNRLLTELGFPSMCIHSKLPQPQRLALYNQFKQYKARILVSTDVFGRGVDIERVNIVINYDLPKTSDDYLHRVGRAGRFGTRGLGISFVSSEEDAKVLEQVQSRFEVKITEMPEKIDPAEYTQA